MVTRVLLLLAGLFGASAQFGAPVVLKPTSSTLLATPSFGYGENAQCDSRGNLYFHATFTFNEIKVLKLGSDGEIRLFTLPPEEAAKSFFLAFRAMRDGDLYIAAQSSDQDEIYVYKMAESASAPDKLSLHVPHGFTASNFARLSSGTIILQGYLDSTADGRDRGKFLLVEFDGAGREITSSLSKPDIQVAKRALTSTPDSAFAESSDGATYLLAGTDILVFTPAGKFMRKFKLPAAPEGFLAGNIYAAGAFLLVRYRKVDKANVSAMYVLLDRATGETVRSYVPNDDLGNNLVCFSENGFTFMRYENRRVKLLYAKP